MTGQLSILIVDDLQFSRIVVKTALKKAGYNGVRMADTAEEALQMLSQQPADLVLADGMMPGMDGFELSDRIRQMDEELGRYTAIILFTAHDGVEYLVKAFEHGVDDYLSKPPHPQELAARVSAAARTAALHNDMLETARQMQQTIDRMEQMALLDELTGAGNERFLRRNLKMQLAEAATRRTGVCLALVELCELDSLRRQHGEAVANEILQRQHQRLRRAVRPMDVICRLEDSRWGDNVFAIVMHYTRPRDYRPAALERVIGMINNRPYKTAAGNLELNARMGLYYYRGDTRLTEVDEMLQRCLDKLEESRYATASIAW